MIRTSFRAGDIVLTRSTSLMGRLIRWAERSRKEEKSRVNHAAIVVEGPETIVEADKKVRRCSIWKHHEDDGILVYRPVSLTPEQILVVVSEAGRWVGRPYPVHQLFTYLIDNKLFGGRTITRKALFLPLGVCSKLLGACFSKIGLDFGLRDPGPDDIDDFCRTHPQHYREVYRQKIEP